MVFILTATLTPRDIENFIKNMKPKMKFENSSVFIVFFTMFHRQKSWK